MQTLSHFSVLCLVTQSCPALCNPMGCSLPGSSVHGDSPGKYTGVGCSALLQGIFPTQGQNTGLPYCRQILYHLSQQGNPLISLLSWKLITLRFILPMESISINFHRKACILSRYYNIFIKLCKIFFVILLWLYL